ncbi:hypothetical protein BJ165DRAFT_1406573 [Panaeolus papilionaceus]|nr:hypothetical protein BJ165DRAFT_1406573 [Panaeolus papilionaceus]
MVVDWMTYEWLEDGGLDHLLYLIPIDETRVPGSRRRTIAMLKDVLNDPTAIESVTFVTTMWDRICSERGQKNAEDKFSQLCQKGGILKDFNDPKLVRFMNTQASALEVLGLSQMEGRVLEEDDYSFRTPYLYIDIYQRLKAVLQEKQQMEEHLADPVLQSNIAVISILQRNQEENGETLKKLIRLFRRWGKPPTDYQLDDMYQDLEEEIKVLESKKTASLSSSSYSFPTPSRIKLEAQSDVLVKDIPQTHIDVAPAFAHSSSKAPLEVPVERPSCEPHSANPQGHVTPESTHLPHKASLLLALKRLVLRVVVVAKDDVIVLHQEASGPLRLSLKIDSCPSHLDRKN